MSNIKNIITIITITVNLIRELVEVFEIPGYGEEKKQAVKDVLSMVFDIIQEYLFELPFTKAKLLEIADGIIDIVVGFFNSTGKFVRGLSAKHNS
jgi:hypothetical protein